MANHTSTVDPLQDFLPQTAQCCLLQEQRNPVQRMLTTMDI